MEITSSNCRCIIEEKLSFLPEEWRNIVASSICALLVKNEYELSCDDVRECETVTELSAFTVQDNKLSISYKDERGVTVKRTINLEGLLNDSPDNVLSGCIVDQALWDTYSYAQKWQAIIDKLCDCCEPTTTTTSTSTTTTVAPCICYTYSLYNPSGSSVFFDYTDCDSIVHNDTEVQSGQTLWVCACAGQEFPAELVMVLISEEECITTTTTTSTSTTTTTTAASCECHEYNIDNPTGGTLGYAYIACDGTFTNATVDGGTNENFCSCQDAVLAPEELIVTDLGITVNCPETTTTTTTSTTTTSTSTTTTTSSTTTTTTCAECQVTLTNDSAGMSITNAEANGNVIDISPFSYPITPGQSRVGTVTVGFNTDLELTISGYTAESYMASDNPNGGCMLLVGNGLNTFPDQDFGCGQVFTVTIEDGPCP